MNSPEDAEVRLPQSVAALVDGNGLAGKIGPTVVLTAVDADGWPRQALLSVGEVLSVSGTDVRLALYGKSRTTRALEASGKGLLTGVIDDVYYKVCVAVERVGSTSGSLAYFVGRVIAVDDDRVGYATISGGVTYELSEPGAVVERWERQLDQLRAVTLRTH